MSTLKLTTLSNFGGTKSVPADTVIDGSAKAWVNFNGKGTVAIRVAFNVSSITDNGVGDFTINFPTAMPDANYTMVGVAHDPGLANLVLQGPITTMANQTSASIRISTVTFASAQADGAVNMVAIFR